ncbi:KipI antagonist [Mycolicibacterium hassiacum DSM 44199]|nr:5-oxoprolinase/urea amidolyase family protein [Mycolicibacterium hassiacum]VCT92858.1 KipI antagonist [Mycolicibacterium hassiacum DSM 44199]
MTESTRAITTTGAAQTTTAALEILRTGPLCLVQDLGRSGLAHMGVSRSGAADRRAHTLANRLVANPGERATIEVTFGGLWARVHGGGAQGLAIAVTGADTDPAVNGRPFGINSVHYVHDGDVISLAVSHTGLRSYLAVRGGFDVSPVLGSRSYDVMSGTGPTPLKPGDVLPIGTHTEDFPELDQAPVAPIEADVLELNVVPGPRDDWFVDPDVLVRTNWLVTNKSDRVGTRLVGMPIEYRDPGRQLPSEGTIRGAIQVPPNGFPVIMGPDHPVTGGYPVIGVITDEDVDKTAQMRPGQTVRMHWSRPRRPFRS